MFHVHIDLISSLFRPVVSEKVLGKFRHFVEPTNLSVLFLFVTKGSRKFVNKPMKTLPSLQGVKGRSRPEEAMYSFCPPL